MQSLIEILNPYSIEEFLNKNWTNKAVYISSQEKNKFSHLFDWEKLTYLLNYHRFKYPDLRLALEGKVLDESANENMIKLCQEGATLILNGVHKLIPELARFTSKVKYDLGYGVQLNAYCSWPGKQGFSSHYDTHEVFILQIDGNKKWYVFPDTFKYPLESQKSSDFTPPETEPYLTCTLKPGDVLYIPRGHWHYAIAVDQPSLHLTLGVHCKTGIDVLDWLVNELRQKQEWRKSLPFPRERGHINDSVNALIVDLKQYLTNKNIGDDYLSYLDSLAKPIAKYSLPYQIGVNIFSYGIETKFTFPKFQQVRIVELSDDDECKILALGKEVSLKGVPISAIEKIFSGDIFSGNDVMNWLPGFDWELDIVPLLSRLVVEGMIFVDTNCEDN